MTKIYIYKHTLGYCRAYPFRAELSIFIFSLNARRRFVETRDFTVGTVDARDGERQ